VQSLRRRGRGGDRTGQDRIDYSDQIEPMVILQEIDSIAPRNDSTHSKEKIPQGGREDG
jgi:hypothetical protein